MESAFDPSPVIVAKMSNMIYDVSDLIVGNLDFTQRNLFTREPGFRVPAEVEYNLEEVSDVFPLTQGRGYFLWKNFDEGFKVVDNLCIGIYQLKRLLICLI